MRAGDQRIQASATFDAVEAGGEQTQGAGDADVLDRLTAAAEVAEAVDARGGEAERAAGTALLDGAADAVAGETQ